MDRVRQLLEEIAVRLRVLNTSQRIAIALCTAMVGGSLIWLMQWSTAPEMVSLVTHDFSFPELDAAEQSLRANDIDHEVHGSRIYVRAADRHNALRVLHSANALPEGSLYDMAAAVTDQNPFQSPDAREYAQNFAKGNELAKIIATASFVKQASVIVNPRSKRRLGGESDVPTASVAITMAPGEEMNEAMVDGFAKLVSGAVAGLKPHNVYITDTATGRSFNVPHPDDAASFDVFGMEKKREAHLQSKVLGALAYIPGVRVSVTVEVDTSKRVTQKLKHDSAQPKVETSQSSETGSQTGAAEPGVQANLGQAITAGGSGQTSTTEESTVENFEPKLSETETIEQIPFATKNATATIGIPRSFIVGVYQAQFPTADKPDDENPDFVKIRDDQIGRVKRGVERIVMAKKPDDVVVHVYPDMEWSSEGGSWSPAAGTGVVAQAKSESFDAVEMLRGYGPQVGLGCLALLSMFTMLRIVRSAPAVAKPSFAGSDMKPGPQQDEPLLASGPSAVGKAAASESLLIGREVDDDTLRYQELGEEVAKLVEADPEGAAELIRRWMDDA